MLSDIKRTTSVKALGFVECSTLSKDNFTRLVLDFPSLLKETREVAAQRRDDLMQYRIQQDLGSRESSKALILKSPDALIEMAAGTCSLCIFHASVLQIMTHIFQYY